MKTVSSLLASAAILGWASLAHAQIAFDSAADAVYTGGNVHGLNGGYGFGPWTSLPTTNGGNAGNITFSSSSQNGNGSSGDIDSAGKSFGLYANSNGISQIVRQITVPMTGIRIITMDFDNGWVDVGQKVYAQIGSYVFGFTGGGANYWYDVGAGPVDSGLPFTTDGLHMKLILNGTGGWNFSVSPNNSQSVWAAANLSGANIPTLVAATNINAGFNASNNSYINNMKILAPEPEAWLAMGVGAAALVVRRRRTR